MYPGRAPPIILVPADSRFDAGMTRRSGVRLPGGGHLTIRRRWRGPSFFPNLISGPSRTASTRRSRSRSSPASSPRAAR